MSFRPFQISASGELDAQPTSAGEKLVVVSDNTGDLNDTVTIRGIVSSAAASNTVTLSTGSKIEKETTDAFTSITGISTSGLTGIVSIYGQGTAAAGDMRVDTIPVVDATLPIGLTGFLHTYTFKSPCRETIQCPLATNMVKTAAAASYVKITLNGVAKYFWFYNAAGPTTDPAPGGTGYSVTVTTADSADTVATALLASMATNLTNFASSRSTDTITITGIALGALTISQDAGNDFTLTAVEAGAADAANQIRTSYDVDGSVASVSDVALWIQYAMNASGGTAGTHYGTGTAAHAYLSALASSATTAITDRIACHRNLGWVITEPTGITARDPIGGAYGTLLATITSTDTIRVAQDFNNPDISDDTLLALFTGATDGILTNGRPSILRLYINNVTTPVQLKVQASDSGVVTPVDSYYDISGTTALSGAVHASGGSIGGYVVTGNASTLFTAELHAGDKVMIDGYVYTVASVTSVSEFKTVEPLVSDPDTLTIYKLLPVQLAYLDNNSQFIQLPQCEYVRINFTTNSNTTDSKLHAGLIV